MNPETILTTIWATLNSPMGIAAVAGLVLWLLNKLYAKKPDWKKYEGTIISAVKWAEKVIPDDSENKAAKRLDAALKYVLSVHADVENRTATAAELATLREGIQIVHAELEATDSLQKNVTTAKTIIILLMVGLLALGGCTLVSVPPGAGPVNVGASSAFVVAERQQTDNAQRQEKQGPTTQPVPLETLSDAESNP